MIDILSNEMNIASVLHLESHQDYLEAQREAEIARITYINAVARAEEYKRKVNARSTELKLKRMSYSSFCDYSVAMLSEGPSIPLPPPEALVCSQGSRDDAASLPSKKRKAGVEAAAAALVAAEAAEAAVEERKPAQRPRLSEEDREFFESDEFKNWLHRN